MEKNGEFFINALPKIIPNDQKIFEPNIYVLSLPLDNKHILMPMPYSDNKTNNIIYRRTDSSNIRALTANHQQWINCENFLFGSKTGLKIFIDYKR